MKYIKYVSQILLPVVCVMCLFNPKLRITRIVSGHFDSLRNDKTGKRSLGDLVSFLVLPAVVSTYLCFVDGAVIDEDDISMLLSMFSIFAALLFNFLMLIIQAKERPIVHSDTVNTEKYLLCIRQTFYNVSFAILLSIFAIILLWICSIWNPSKQVETNIFSWLIMTITIMFFLVLFMVLKRIFNIYNIDN